MLFQGKVSIAFEEEDIFKHVGAVCQAFLDIAEFVAEAFMDVPLFAVVMQPGRGIIQGAN